MLVRLYDLPDASAHYRRAEEAGVIVRRAGAWERTAVRSFIEGAFSVRWADETEAGFARQPVSVWLATSGGEIVGFAAYEVTARGYFGPTGVREDLRGRGIGTALLFRCLESLWELGYAYGIIGGVFEAREFYEKVCEASVIPGSEKGIYEW